MADLINNLLCEVILRLGKLVCSTYYVVTFHLALA